MYIMIRVALLLTLCISLYSVHPVRVGLPNQVDEFVGATNKYSITIALDIHRAAPFIWRGMNLNLTHLM